MVGIERVFFFKRVPYCVPPIIVVAASDIFVSFSDDISRSLFDIKNAPIITVNLDAVAFRNVVR